MEPIEITTWQCPICRTVYDEKDEAIACSNKPNPTPRFEVGDTVYIQEYCPEDREKPFVKRVVTEICGVFKDVGDVHRVGYNLNELVYHGKSRPVGGWRDWNWEGTQPALEDDLYRLGDRRLMWIPSTQQWEEVTLTEDKVSP